MVRIVVVLVFLLLFPVLVSAQTDTPTPSDTPTPTITLTPSATPTATPDFYAVFTLMPAPTEITGEGTPTPAAQGQAVAVVYTMTAGEVVSSSLLFVLIVTVWSMFVSWLFLRRKG